MGIKDRFKKFRDDYVIRQVANFDIPEFTDGPIKRYSIVFRGRVQKVGFRITEKIVGELDVDPSEAGFTRL